MKKVLVHSLFGLCLGIVGCQTTTHVIGQADSGSSRVQTRVSGAPASGAPAFGDGTPVSADDAIGTDPCDAHLQNIEAAILLYDSVNRQLPDKLEDLVALSSGDLDLTCPVSHQQYLYNKDGLVTPGMSKRIIVSDPTPAHGGKRWCILMAPSTPGAALVLETREISEAVFNGYQPAQ
jgi:hypothetical protein